MNKRNVSILVAVVVAATCVSALLLTSSEPPLTPSAPPARGSIDRASSEDRVPPEPSRPTTPQDWEAELGGEPEFVSEDLPEAPQRDRLQMLVAEKLAPEPLSEVPHELVGAWDDLPDSAEPGAHRTIVAVVAADMPAIELERFVRDIRRRHADAEILDVRVYDSETAATAARYRDGGAERARHLVADVKRNDRLGFDQISVRGEDLRP